MNVICRLILFSLIFISNINCFSIPKSPIIKSYIEKFGGINEIYIAEVYIGNPTIKYKLEVRFDYRDIIIYDDLKEISTSFIEFKTNNSILNEIESDSRDIVFLSDEKFIFPVISDKYKTLSPSDTKCPRKICQGILGLKKDSFLWGLYPEISFTRNSITFGQKGIGFTDSQNLSNEFYCDIFNSLDILCETNLKSIEFNNKIYNETKIRITLHGNEIYLPKIIYNEYILGKNIYKKKKKLTPIKFNFNDEISFELNEGDFLKHLNLIDNNKKLLLLANEEENTVIIGTNLLKHVIINKNTFNSKIILKIHESVDNLSVLNLILILILVWYLSRWKMTNLTILLERQIRFKNSALNLFFEFSVLIFVGLSFFLPSTWRILKEFPLFYFSIGFVLATFIIFKVISIYISVYILNNNLFYKWDLFIQTSILRNSSQEILNLYSLWLILLERRLEGLSTVLIAIINIYLVYVISFYLLVSLIYILNIQEQYKEKNRNRGHQDYQKFTSYAIFLFLLMIIIYQALVTVNFFIFPLFTRDFQIYQQLIIPITVLIYILIIIAVSNIVTRYMMKGFFQFLYELKNKDK